MQIFISETYFFSMEFHYLNVQLFWEGRNLPQGFDIYLVNVKTLGKIVQIFVAFSEKLNFKYNMEFPDDLLLLTHFLCQAD